VLEQIRNYRRGDYVFTDESGNMLHRHGAVRSSFERIVNKLGLTDFRFHDLRHTFASDLAMKGADIKTISELLGHGSTRMSERYMHLSPNHKRVAVEMLAPLKNPSKWEYSENVAIPENGGINETR
jgi:integrase